MVQIVKKIKRNFCETCRFYIDARLSDGNRFNPELTGICRRFPPQGVAYDDGEHHIETTVWPMVNSKEWCGEHAAP